LENLRINNYNETSEVSPDVIINDVSYNTSIRLLQEIRIKYPLTNIEFILNKKTNKENYKRGLGDITYAIISHMPTYNFEIDFYIHNITDTYKIKSGKFYDLYNLLKLSCKLYDNYIKIDSIIRDCCSDIILDYDVRQERSNESLRNVNICSLSKKSYNNYANMLFSNSMSTEKDAEIKERIKGNDYIYNNIKIFNKENKNIMKDMKDLPKTIQIERDMCFKNDLRHLYNIEESEFNISNADINY